MRGLLRRLRAPLLVGIGLAQVGLLLSGVFAARALGIDGRGYLATAMLVPTLAAYVGSASADPLVAALIAKGASARATVETAIRVVAQPVLACAAAAGTIVHQLLHDPVVGASAAVAVVSLATMSLATGVAVGLQRDPLVAIVQAASPLLYGATTYIAFLGGVTDFRIYAASWAGATVVSAAVMALIVARVIPRSGEAPPPRHEFRRRTYLGLFSSYSPLESFRGDQVLVLATLGNGALGLYSVALALSNAAKLLGMVASWTVPAMSRLTPNGRLRRMALMSAILLVGGVAFSITFPLLVPLLFGDEFADAGIVALVLGIAGALFAVRKVLVESLRLLAHEGRATLIELGAAAVFIVTGVWLAFTADILGVAVALIVAAALTVGVGWWQLIRATHRHPGESPARDNSYDEVAVPAP